MTTTTLTTTATTSDYQESRAAMFRAKELLAQAMAEICSAEAFSETGYAGRMRDDVQRELKKARLVSSMAAWHVGAATR